MKKIISIAFVAILVGLAISCQKEEAVSDKTDAVQYTFNITVADQVGFDSDVSTKKADGPSYKSGWENGDRIFLFFKPTSGSLLGDRYATLTYNESSWDGTVSSGTSNLGDGGTLSAVYVYKLDGSVTPAYSDSKWTIPTGNTFYNCQTEVNYTVSGNEISASLDLKAPADFVCFSIYDTSGDALTCNKVKGWKDVVIGSEMTFSNATCTGYMTGFDNIDGSNYKDYYGRIVGGGTSLNGLTCNFSVVKDGKVYERTATPSSDKRSFYMDRSATGDKKWTEAAGKLPGLFTVGKGADGTAGTEDDVQVRFSKGNLYAKDEGTAGSPVWKWHFYDEQYKCNSLNTGCDEDGNREVDSGEKEIDLFTWGYSASTSLDADGTNYVESHTTSDDNQLSSSDGGDDWGFAYCESNGITAGTWRTLSTAEWQYLFNYGDYTSEIRENKCRWATVNGVGGYVIAPDGFTGTLQESYANDAGLADAGNLVFLPAAGYRLGSNVFNVGDFGFYWSSTAGDFDDACRARFDGGGVSPGDCDLRNLGFSVRLITESN